MTRVLVLDDDVSTAELLRVVLEDAAFSVTVATSPEPLPPGPFDCVVTDLMSTTVYSVDAAQAWLGRLERRYPGTALILVSAHPEVAADRARLAARQVVVKPFDVDQLVGAVRDAAG